MIRAAGAAARSDGRIPKGAFMTDGTFKLRGYKPPQPGGSLLQSSRVRVRAELRPAASRSGTELEAVETVRADELMELEFEHGFRLWLRGDEYRGRATAEAKRTRGGPPADGVLEVSGTWPVEGLPAERGFGGMVLKGLKLFGIDPIRESVLAIAARFEAGKSGDPKHPGSGFYRVRAATGAFALEAAGTVPTDEPVLVLIHGTASSTWGSFGDLWSAARADALGRLRDRYNANIFALEHKSLTESVVANALSLANALPSGARIDLLTHSRGGLVGELFSRGSITAGEPFDAAELELAGILRDSDELGGTAAKAEAIRRSLKQVQDDLTELGRVLKKGQGIKVERFARVACPALGTTLLSGKLDRWLSVVANVGALAAPGSPIAETASALGDFIAAVVEKKTDPSALPGLAFFLADAGLLRVVNNTEREVGGRLAVIAGDLDPKGIWQKLLTLVLDRFYDGAHDLVVNTESMYGGTPRTERNAILSAHRGPAVNHFNYFTNKESADAIAAALCTPLDQDPARFERLRPPAGAIARGGEFTRAPAGPTPYVFVLPGIMGSELAAGDDRIWVDYWRLAQGKLARLAISATDVRPIAPYRDYYGELLEFLAESHKVVPYAFDWRLSPNEEAKRLASDLRRKVEDAKREGVAVRILAHSMGGLVVRAMIAGNSELWRDFAALPGARFVMLGTPNGGSHSITELLVGQSATFGALALLDVTHSTLKLLEIVARFPGVLAMLPNHGSSDWFDLEVWDRFARGSGSGWAVPDKDDLKEARAFRALIDGSPVDPMLMTYVAGCAPQTPQDMRFGVSEMGATTIEFEATAEGDGRVTWASGIPAGLKPWYMPVSHGDLSATPEQFPAILDLLRTGRTDRLSQAAPVQRGAMKPFVMVRQPAQSLPDQQALGAAIMGAAPRRRRPKGAPAIEVTVLNGDLAYASHPVMVGHYAGDTIISAEAQLDGWLGGRLRELHSVGLYPGPIETSEVVFDPTPENPARVNAAIVVGLGKPGELTVDGLKRTIAHGALSYAIRYEQSNPTPAPTNEAGVRELSLTSLLVGTLAGGVRISDAVMAILQGVQRANAALELAGRPIRIARLQLIELFEDGALQAAKALTALGMRTQMREAFTFDGKVVDARGGRRRLAFDEQPGWWQRLQILGRNEQQQEDDLRFLALTRRARAEVSTTATQRALVDEFVKRAIQSNATDPAIGATLFELLVPNALKDQAPEQDNLLLILDEAAARYPWELLQDPTRQGDQPFAVERGMLRQLATERYQPTVRGTTEDNALVVGDPLLPVGGNLRQLPAARLEAGSVAAKLREGPLATTVLEGPSAVEVLKELFARPYKILHLAGHGVHDEEYVDAAGNKKRVTGMVIGDRLYLTPTEVRQMRSVPELVFINCCHLGLTGEPGVTAPTRAPAPPAFNLIAANVGTQFIEMGVRAVIAAGWAIDDRAAQKFADTFYESMLAGVAFGEAVKRARERTWQDHKYANTWGAYQCYGDPEYRLRLAGARDGQGDISLRSVADAVCEIENVQRDLAVRAAESVERWVKRLDDLEKAIAKRGWEKDARCLVALARAYGEAHEFGLAIDRYQQAMQRNDAALALKDLEKFANYKTRLALLRWRSGAGQAAGLLGRIDDAIERLQWLIDRDGAGAGRPAADERPSATAERFNLLGSAYKRRAWIDAANRARDLKLAFEAYASAFAIAQRAGRDTAYPLLNKIQSALVLRWQGVSGAPTIGAADRAAIEAAAKALDASAAAQTEFWDAASRADRWLTVALLDDALTPQEEERLVQHYLYARRIGSPREFASVLDQIEFLAAMATSDAIKAPLERIARLASGGARATPAPAATAKPRPPGKKRPARRISKHASGKSPRGKS